MQYKCAAAVFDHQCINSGDSLARMRGLKFFPAIELHQGLVKDSFDVVLESQKTCCTVSSRR